MTEMDITYQLITSDLINRVVKTSILIWSVSFSGRVFLLPISPHSKNTQSPFVFSPLPEDVRLLLASPGVERSWKLTYIAVMSLIRSLNCQ